MNVSCCSKGKISKIFVFGCKRGQILKCTKPLFGVVFGVKYYAFWANLRLLGVYFIEKNENMPCFLASTY